MSRRVNLQRWGTWAWFQLCMNAFYHMPVIFALAFYEENIAPFFSPPFFLKAKFKTIILMKVNLVLIFISKYVQWLDWSNILLQNFISSPWSILPDFRSPLSYMLHQPFDEIACHHQRERERKKKKGGGGKVCLCMRWTNLLRFLWSILNTEWNV